MIGYSVMPYVLCNHIVAARTWDAGHDPVKQYEVTTGLLDWTTELTTGLDWTIG